MVKDATIVWACNGAQFNASVLDLKRLDLLGAIGGQAILQIDGCKRRRELTQVSRGCANHCSELPKTPVGRRKGRVPAR